MPSSRKPKSLRTVLAENVRAARESRGWSQEQLAEKAGLSQVYISQIETAKTAASVDTLEKLAGGLSLEPGELVRDSAG